MNDPAAAAAGGGCRPPFTALQWEELKHQALIFKYLVYGVPVPPGLLLHIRRSIESTAARFHRQPPVGSGADGKKLDPEPWRCRRTDGKKWRCSKHAYPDSRYCERHMHRGRTRSRKPVETQSLSQLQQASSPSSTVTTLTPTGSSMSGGSGSTSGSIRSFPSGISLRSFGGGSGGNPATQVSFTGSSLSQLQADPGYYGMGVRDYRVVESTVDQRSFLSEASGSTGGGLGVDSSLNSSWCLMPSQASCYLPKPNNLQGSSYPQLQSTQDFGHEAVGLLSDQQQQQQQQQQHYFLGGEFEPVKQESQPLRSFFDEWPNTRDSWSDLEDDRSNRTSFSTTQLSISLPIASSDFSATSSRSPSGDD